MQYLENCWLENKCQYSAWKLLAGKRFPKHVASFLLLSYLPTEIWILPQGIITLCSSFISEDYTQCIPHSCPLQAGDRELLQNTCFLVMSILSQQMANFKCQRESRQFNTTILMYTQHIVSSPLYSIGFNGSEVAALRKKQNNLLRLIAQTPTTRHGLPQVLHKRMLREVHRKKGLL